MLPPNIQRVEFRRSYRPVNIITRRISGSLYREKEWQFFKSGGGLYRAAASAVAADAADAGAGIKLLMLMLDRSLSLSVSNNELKSTGHYRTQLHSP